MIGHLILGMVAGALATCLVILIVMFVSDCKDTEEAVYDLRNKLDILDTDMGELSDRIAKLEREANSDEGT